MTPGRCICAGQPYALAYSLIASLGVGIIMGLIRVFATSIALVDLNSKGRMQWAGFDLVSKAMSRA